MFFSPLSRAGDFHARSRFARSTILEGKPQPRPQGAFPWENKGYSQSTIFIAVRALAVVKIRGRRGGRGGGGWYSGYSGGSVEHALWNTYFIQKTKTATYAISVGRREGALHCLT